MGNINSMNATNNEKNLCRLYLAVRKTGPVAIAFAEIYILLNKLSPGQTVREYCQDVLGYNSKKYGNVFNTDERNILSGSWDPKLQDVSFLYKLLFHVCGLSPDGQNWVDPAYPLEFNLHTAKNRRNDTMHSRIELTDSELQALSQELEHSMSAAISLAGVKKGRNISTQGNAFKLKMHNYLNKESPWYYNPLRVLADSIGFASGSAGIASGSVGIAAASAVSKSAGITSDFGSVGAASASTVGYVQQGDFGHEASEINDQISGDELMECLMECLIEVESLEFHGISDIIRRQVK